jgi:hypothetical protein
MSIEFLNSEGTDKELLEGWIENLHSYHLKLMEANNGYLELQNNIVFKNRVSSIGKDIIDLLQDIKNIQ